MLFKAIKLLTLSLIILSISITTNNVVAYERPEKRDTLTPNAMVDVSDEKMATAEEYAKFIKLMRHPRNYIGMVVKIQITLGLNGYPSYEQLIEYARLQAVLGYEPTSKDIARDKRLRSILGMVATDDHPTKMQHDEDACLEAIVGHEPRKEDYTRAARQFGRIHGTITITDKLAALQRLKSFGITDPGITLVGYDVSAPSVSASKMAEKRTAVRRLEDLGCLEPTLLQLQSASMRADKSDDSLRTYTRLAGVGMLLPSPPQLAYAIAHPTDSDDDLLVALRLIYLNLTPEPARIAYIAAKPDISDDEIQDELNELRLVKIR